MKFTIFGPSGSFVALFYVLGRGSSFVEFTSYRFWTLWLLSGALLSTRLGLRFCEIYHFWNLRPLCGAILNTCLGLWFCEIYYFWTLQLLCGAILNTRPGLWFCEIYQFWTLWLLLCRHSKYSARAPVL